MNLTPSEEERADLEWLADIGEIAGPIAHEVNNFLNVCLLNVALLEQEASEKLRPFLKEIRRQGARTAEMIRQWQQYRRSRQPQPQRVDLNGVVREVLKAFAPDLRDPGASSPIRLRPAHDPDQGPLPTQAGASLILQLQANLPPVLASVSALKRLVSFLLSNAVAATQGKGQVTLRTERANDSIRLCVEDSGPSIAPELLPQMFEPFIVSREGTNALELAVCKTLVRRMEGQIQGTNRAEGGAAIFVEMKAANAEPVS
jgi:signal transduction histidine kinase